MSEFDWPVVAYCPSCGHAWHLPFSDAKRVARIMPLVRRDHPGYPTCDDCAALDWPDRLIRDAQRRLAMWWQQRDATQAQASRRRRGFDRAVRS